MYKYYQIDTNKTNSIYAGPLSMDSLKNLMFDMKREGINLSEFTVFELSKHMQSSYIHDQCSLDEFHKRVIKRNEEERDRWEAYGENMWMA